MDKNTTLILIIVLVAILGFFAFFTLRKNKKETLVEDKSVKENPSEPISTKNIAIESKGNQAFAVLTGANDILETLGALVASLKNKTQTNQELTDNEKRWLMWQASNLRYY